MFSSEKCGMVLWWSGGVVKMCSGSEDMFRCSKDVLIVQICRLSVDISSLPVPIYVVNMMVWSYLHYPYMFMLCNLGPKVKCRIDYNWDFVSDLPRLYSRGRVVFQGMIL